MVREVAPNQEFEEMLTGGHPNSLGRTVEVVDMVLADRPRLADLYSQGVFMSYVARGTFEVNLQPMPFEGADPAWKLGRMSIDKQISGDLVATTKGQMISATTNTQGSAG